MIEFTTPLLLGLGAGLLVTGAVVGVLAGLLGVGGGIIIVPVLIVVAEAFGIDDQIAMLLVVGTSLATIIPTSISSARAHRKKGAIDTGILRGWVPAIFVGALMGGIVSKFIDSSGLMLIFGVVALIVAINCALPKTITLAPHPPASRAAQSAIALPIGFTSALMGVGAEHYPSLSCRWCRCPCTALSQRHRSLGWRLRCLRSSGSSGQGSTLRGAHRDHWATSTCLLPSPCSL